jgi:hypothetical protein
VPQGWRTFLAHRERLRGENCLSASAPRRCKSTCPKRVHLKRWLPLPHLLPHCDVELDLILTNLCCGQVATRIRADSEESSMLNLTNP